MNKIIGHLIKDYIAIQVYLLWISLMKILFVISMLIAICFTSDTYKDFYENDSLKTKLAYRVFDNVRYNLRIIVGTFLPISSLIENQISPEEQKNLPKPEQALFQMDRNQWAGLKMMSFESKILENMIFQGYNYTKKAYKEYNWGSIDWNLMKERSSTNEKDMNKENIKLY